MPSCIDCRRYAMPLLWAWTIGNIGLGEVPARGGDPIPRVKVPALDALADPLLRESLRVGQAAEPVSAIAEARLQAWFRFAGNVRQRGPALERAERLFRYLHAQLLTGPFVPRCGSVARTLSHGEYNCLTATLLYVNGCRWAGIDVEAWSPAPDHVLAIARCGDGAIAIEMTSAAWAPVQMSPALERQGRRLDDSDLRARLHYNHGLELAVAGRFEEALQATEACLADDSQFLPAHANRLAILNNWCVTLMQNGNMSAARNVAEQGLQWDPNYAPLRACLAALPHSQQGSAASQNGSDGD